MRIAPFALERYFARHEFTARHLLSASDCEASSMAELLELADAETSRLWSELRLGYTESPGHPLLREAIAALYPGVDPGDVLVVVPEEGIFLLVHALLERGDHVICTWPAYQSLHEVARAIGCEVSPWEPDEARGWRFDLEALEALLRPETRLIVVNFPHNPTGHVPPAADFEALLELARGRGVHLLSDEMYRFLEVDRGATLPAACERYGRAASLCGLSKTFGLPGLRVGWVVTRDRELLARVAALKDYTTICGSAPAEILAIIALRAREAIIGRQVARIRRNLTALDAFFGEHRQRMAWNRPAGGSVCLPRVLAAPDTAALCEELLRETGIMLVPSALFGYGGRHVRIGFGREDLPVVLDRFSDYLRGRFP
jgi:aspartate/methionine/tyrosine aminotransferase